MLQSVNLPSAVFGENMVIDAMQFDVKLTVIQWYGEKSARTRGFYTYIIDRAYKLVAGFKYLRQVRCGLTAQIQLHFTIEKAYLKILVKHQKFCLSSDYIGFKSANCTITCCDQPHHLMVIKNLV